MGLKEQNQTYPFFGPRAGFIEPTSCDLSLYELKEWSLPPPSSLFSFFEMRGRLGLNPKRLTTHRFEQIPDYPSEGIMSNPHDVAIDIPLGDSPSKGKDQPVDAEKAGHGHGHGPGRRRRHEHSDITDATGKPSESPEDGSLNRLGRVYQAIYNFSIVTRYMIYVLPIGALIAIPIIVGATAAQDAYIGGVHLYWFFTWIEVVWVSLWVCKVFAKFFPYVFQYLCGIVSSGTRKYALILRALETPITIVLWVVVSLVTFLPVSSSLENLAQLGFLTQCRLCDTGQTTTPMSSLGSRASRTFSSPC